jgi:hypothetical protein
MIRLSLRNGRVIGISRNRRTLTAHDIVNGVDVPKKLGVTGFGREIKTYRRRI